MAPKTTATVAPTVTQEEVEKAFIVCDSNASGFIAIKRLKIVLRALGFEPRQAEIDKLVKKMQENEPARAVSSDSFTVEELCHVIENKIAASEQDEAIRGAFELFDTERKGFIAHKDLKRVARELGEDELEDKDLWEMIHIADFTKKGRVTFDDFRVIMKKTKMY